MQTMKTVIIAIVLVAIALLASADNNTLDTATTELLEGFGRGLGETDSPGPSSSVSTATDLRDAMANAPTDGSKLTIYITTDISLGELGSGPNFSCLTAKGGTHIELIGVGTTKPILDAQGSENSAYRRHLKIETGANFTARHLEFKVRPHPTHNFAAAEKSSEVL